VSGDGDEEARMSLGARAFVSDVFVCSGDREGHTEGQG
jgi:hypothetical protein